MHSTAETGKSALPALEPGGPSSSVSPTSPLTQAVLTQVKSQRGTPHQTRKQSLPSRLREAGRHRCPALCPGKFTASGYPCSGAGLDGVAAGTQCQGMDACKVTGAWLHPSLASSAPRESRLLAPRFDAPREGLGNACSSEDEWGCSTPTRQGGWMGRGDTAWVAPSPSANGSSTKHTDRSDFPGIPVTLNLCLHTSSLAASSAQPAQKLPCHCRNLGLCHKQGAIPPVPDG